MLFDKSKVSAVILAGGQSRRMNGVDKPLAQLGSARLIEHVIDALAAQADQIVISCNGDEQRFNFTELACFSDPPNTARGPLEGILAGINFFTELSKSAKWLLVTPADCPFIPSNLAQKLLEGLSSKGGKLAYTSYRGRKHYLCSLWSMALAPDISAYLDQGDYAVRHLLSRLNAVEVEFDAEAQDPFFNINTEADLQEAKHMLDT